MADEKQQGQVPENDDQNHEEPETPPETGGDSDDEFDPDRAMNTIRTLRQEVKDAKKDRKELDKLRAKLQAQEDAEKTELQRAQDAVAAAEQRAQEADKRAVRAEARAIAAEQGIDAKRIPYAVKMLDLDAIEVSDDGEPDSDAITEAVKQVITDIPELVSKGGPNGKIGGTNPPNTNGLDGLKPYDQMTIEEQTELYHRDRTLWERARAAAGFGD